MWAPTLTLKDDTGATLAVTLVKIVDPAAGADSASTPDAGKRFVAAQFKIATSAAISGSPDSDAKIIDSAGQGFDPSFVDSVAGCESFGARVNIGAGESQTGCVVFSLPTADPVAKVQFTPSAGFANDFAEWLVP